MSMSSEKKTMYITAAALLVVFVASVYMIKKDLKDDPNKMQASL